MTCAASISVFQVEWNQLKTTLACTIQAFACSSQHRPIGWRGDLIFRETRIQEETACILPNICKIYLMDGFAARMG